MSGKAGRSGRRPLSAATHILNGTWRKDRHGPRPVTAGATARSMDVPPMPQALVAGLGERGLQFAIDVWATYGEWTPGHLVILRQAAELVDSFKDYASILARDGALVTTARGRQAPHPLLRAQGQARATFLALHAALDLKEE